MTLTLYGIKNCDTVRRARRWLQDHDRSHRYHDLREDGLPPSTLTAWADQLGWEALINRRSASWRQLSEEQRSQLDRQRTLELILAHPTLLRRPLLARGDDVLQGFAPEDYARWLEQSDPS